MKLIWAKCGMNGKSLIRRESLEVLKTNISFLFLHCKFEVLPRYYNTKIQNTKWLPLKLNLGGYINCPFPCG
jgi:hypothetical protein